MFLLTSELDEESSFSIFKVPTKFAIADSEDVYNLPTFDRKLVEVKFITIVGTSQWERKLDTDYCDSVIAEADIFLNSLDCKYKKELSKELSAENLEDEELQRIRAGKMQKLRNRG